MANMANIVSNVSKCLKCLKNCMSILLEWMGFLSKSGKITEMSVFLKMSKMS